VLVGRLVRLVRMVGLVGLVGLVGFVGFVGRLVGRLLGLIGLIWLLWRLFRLVIRNKSVSPELDIDHGLGLLNLEVKTLVVCHALAIARTFFLLTGLGHISMDEQDWLRDITGADGDTGHHVALAKVHTDVLGQSLDIRRTIPRNQVTGAAVGRHVSKRVKDLGQLPQGRKGTGPAGGGVFNRVVLIIIKPFVIDLVLAAKEGQTNPDEQRGSEEATEERFDSGLA
jgi:hypothetical protein